jgi:hypothetical protein
MLLAAKSTFQCPERIDSSDATEEGLKEIFPRQSKASMLVGCGRMHDQDGYVATNIRTPQLLSIDLFTKKSLGV